MAVTLVQQFAQVSNHWAASATCAAKTLPVAATVGNLIIVIASIGNDTTESVVSMDDAGTTPYARANRVEDSTTGNVHEIWFGIAAGTNPGTGVTITKGGTSDNGTDSITIVEFAGNAATQASLSVNGNTTGPATSHDSGSVTPGVADNVIVAISRGSDRAWTVDADFTALLDNERTTVAYKIQSSNTAQSYTVTSDIDAFAVLNIVAFKGSAVTAYNMLAEQGSYTLTGQTATLLTGGFLTAEAGSYTLLGSEALRDVEMDAEQGSYALNGQVANLVQTALLTAEAGTYTLIGQAANLLYSVSASIGEQRRSRRMFGFRLNR